MITINNVVKRFGNRTVPGRYRHGDPHRRGHGDHGEQRLRKSTLLRVLVGHYRPDEGDVYYDGRNIVGMKERELDEVRKQFGILFQGGGFAQLVDRGRKRGPAPAGARQAQARRIVRIIIKMKLELVGLSGFEDLKPSQISGGMKKRVGLARAIALDPKTVFYDEPGAGLDPITAAVIDELILDLSKKLGMTSVVVTHEMNSAFKIADRMAMLHEWPGDRGGNARGHPWQHKPHRAAVHPWWCRWSHPVETVKGRIPEEPDGIDPAGFSLQKEGPQTMEYYRQEIKAGVLVIVSFLVLCFFLFHVAGIQRGAEYDEYVISFSDIGGLMVNAPVRYAGVDAGHVSWIRIVQGGRFCCRTWESP